MHQNTHFETPKNLKEKKELGGVAVLPSHASLHTPPYSWRMRCLHSQRQAQFKTSVGLGLKMEALQAPRVSEYGVDYWGEVWGEGT